jgi:proline dehydrogenase
MHDDGQSNRGGLPRAPLGSPRAATPLLDCRAMNPLRGLLLAASDNAWLREHATRYRFVRQAVARFMPGETLDDGLRAAAGLHDQGLGAILTHLGENVSDRAEAEAEAQHYLDALDRIRAAGLDAEVSVKLTQLGLDLAPDLACEHVRKVATRAGEHGRRLWIDMEGSAYTEITVDLYRRLLPQHRNLGVALQAYLYRTQRDVEALMPLGGAIRIVKGAYREPPSVAFPTKRDVDRNFLTLTQQLLGPEARSAGLWVAVATHDRHIIARIEALVRAGGVPRDGFEFAMLYGIGREEQRRLARQGQRMRVLISYGSHWFPWYMRRLAERPANLWFVVRSVLGG